MEESKGEWEDIPISKDYISSNPRDVHHNEHESWIEMFPILEKLSGKTREELNSMKWRELFIAIEKWGFYEHERRMALNDHKARGVFWERKD